MKNTNRRALGMWAAAAMLMVGAVRLASLQSPHPNRQTPNPYNIVASDLDERDRLREARDRMRQILDLAGVNPGMVVGEAGAGDGYFTLMLADRVGPTGKVFANDIDRDALESLKERARRRNLSNIETVTGTEDDPRLPGGKLDMVFIINAFHDFNRPVEMLRRLAPSLKRDGTLNIVEYGQVAAVNQKRTPPRHQAHLDNFAKSGFAVEKTDHVDLGATEDFCPVLYVLSLRRELPGASSGE